MNKFQIKMLLLTPLCVLLLLAVSGCKTDEAGVTSTGGWLSTTVAAEPEEVLEATEEAFEDLDLSVIQKGADKTAGQAIARNARDTKIEVDFKRTSPGISELNVWAGGMVPDSELGMTVMNQIRDNLGVERNEVKTMDKK